MVHLSLNDDQLRQIAESTSPILLTDSQGRVVGRASRLSEQDAADVQQALRNIEASKADPRPAVTTEQLLAHLRSLAPE